MNTSTCEPAADVKARPILFAAPMIQAILAGAKTQTRRILKPQPEQEPHPCHWVLSGWAEGREHGGCSCCEIKCPFGEVGSRLWVREALWVANGGKWIHDANGFAHPFGDGDKIESPWVQYVADDEHGESLSLDYWKKRPAIHMPRWASRITLEITEIRAERLNSITPEDAMAEGAMFSHGDPFSENPSDAEKVQAFRDLWDGINGKREGCDWAANCWVWVVSFRRLVPEVRDDR